MRKDTAPDCSETESVNPSEKLIWSDSTEGFLKHFSGNHIFFAALENKEQKDATPEKDRPKPRHFSGEFKTLENDLRDLNSRDWGIFFTVNELDQSLDPGHYRTAKMVTRCRAIWIDDDHIRDEPRTDFPIPPNIVVQSSKGKYHYHWLTDTDSRDEWEGVMETMVQEHGCDKNAKDAARVLRLPGFDHNKDKPFPVTCDVKIKEPYSWAVNLRRNLIQ